MKKKLFVFLMLCLTMAPLACSDSTAPQISEPQEKEGPTDPQGNQ